MYGYAKKKKLKHQKNHSPSPFDSVLSTIVQLENLREIEWFFALIILLSAFFPKKNLTIAIALLGDFAGSKANCP